MKPAAHAARSSRNLATRINALESRSDGIIVRPLTGGAMDWTLLPFGWTTTGVAAGHVLILTGDVIKGTYTPVAVDEVDIDLVYASTYVGIQIDRPMTNISIIASETKPVSDDDYVRFWFYQFANASGSVTLLKANLGQIMNVDITAYGDD